MVDATAGQRWHPFSGGLIESLIMILRQFTPPTDRQQAEQTMLKRVALVLAAPEIENWPHHITQAKKVLRAMREPTSSMLAAVEKDSMCWQPLSEDWNTMIEQALRDAEPVVFQNIILRTGS